jgi:hypothetical protein
MQVFIVGPPRSGTTIVSQVMNADGRIKIFDEIDLINVAEFGEHVVGKLRAFLFERGAYDAFRELAGSTDDCALALRQVMEALAAPALVWGEKNPLYATRLEVLRRLFPDALFLFVQRDPRAVVNSYLAHRASPLRRSVDFWIKDTVAEALALVESCLQPLEGREGDVAVLRYEEFVEQPKPVLDRILERWRLELHEPDLAARYDAPETLGAEQFFRQQTVLPWKSGNLSPLRREPQSRDRIDAGDPAWAKVDALAATLGYAA